MRHTDQVCYSFQKFVFMDGWRYNNDLSYSYQLQNIAVLLASLSSTTGTFGNPVGICGSNETKRYIQNYRLELLKAYLARLKSKVIKIQL